MRIVLLKSKDAKQGTQRVEKQLKRELSTKETGKNSTTSGTTAPEVWIMSGLLLSLVMQIVSVSHLPKLGDPPEDN